MRRVALLEQAGREHVPIRTAEHETPDGVDPDVAFAEAKAQSLLAGVEKFSEWEFDEPEWVTEVTSCHGPHPAVIARATGVIVSSEWELLRPQRSVLSLGAKERRKRRELENGRTIVWRRRSRHAGKDLVRSAQGTAAASVEDAPAMTERSEERSLNLRSPTSTRYFPQTASRPQSSFPTQLPLFDEGADEFGDGADVVLEPRLWDEADEPEHADDIAEDAWDEAESPAPIGLIWCDEQAFDWAEIDVSVDDEEEAREEECLSIEQADESALPSRVELWRRIEQIALEELIKAGRLEDRAAARREMRILTRILLEGLADSRRPDVSARVRARHVGELLQAKIPMEEIAAAHACRQAWAESPELHIDLGSRAYWRVWPSSFPWKHALRMARLFGACEIEEFRCIFFSMFERWGSRESLQRMFPSFISYVFYRLVRTGCDLDEHPHWVFDDPDGVDCIEQWEDDPVQALSYRAYLAAHGLIPDLN